MHESEQVIATTALGQAVGGQREVVPSVERDTVGRSPCTGGQAWCVTPGLQEQSHAADQLTAVAHASENTNWPRNINFGVMNYYSFKEVKNCHFTFSVAKQRGTCRTPTNTF